jgi:predicted transcriptional regulator
MTETASGKRPAVVRDVMIPLSEHPHVPYWLTIRQAMVVLREIALEQERGRYYEPTLLVFDQEYNLLGIVRRRHLLAAVEPRLTDPEAFDVEGVPGEKACLHDSEEVAVHCLADAQTYRAGFNLQVSEVMTPIRAVAGPEDCIVKAFHTMVRVDVAMLPVMERDQVLGVVRWTDLFNEILGGLLEQ